MAGPNTSTGHRNREQKKSDKPGRKYDEPSPEKYEEERKHLLEQKRSNVTKDLTRIEEEREVAQANRDGEALLESPVLVWKAKDAKKPERLNFYDAFGTVHIPRLRLPERYKVVVEVKTNDIMKRYYVPDKYVTSGKWLFTGDKVYVYKGHAFVSRHHQEYECLVCFVCYSAVFKSHVEEYYACRDCNIPCHKMCYTRVKEHCSNSKILTLEMEFPYDEIEEKLREDN